LRSLWESCDLGAEPDEPRNPNLEPRTPEPTIVRKQTVHPRDAAVRYRAASGSTRRLSAFTDVSTRMGRSRLPAWRTATSTWRMRLRSGRRTPGSLRPAGVAGAMHQKAAAGLAQTADFNV